MSARPAKADPPLKHPSARRTAGLFGLLAGLGAVASGAACFTGAYASAAVIATMAIGSGAFARWLHRAFHFTAIHNKATDVLLRGQLDEATNMLEPLASASGLIGQSVALQLANIALLRGDMKKAEGESTRCIERSPYASPTSARYVTLLAGRATRAFARASLGDAAGAREDIAFVRGAQSRPVASLARATVAELVLCAAASDTEGLVRVLSENERVLEHAAPRERALVHGFERMVASGGSSIYRKPQTRESEDNAVGDWMSAVAPGLRGFVPAGSAKRHAEAVPARAGDVGPPLRKAQRNVRTRRVLALWVLLIVMFVAIWQFLTPVPGARHTAAVGEPYDVTNAFLLGMPLLFVVLFGSLVAVQVRRARKSAVRIRDLQNAVLLGDEAAVKQVELLTRVTAPGTAASAFLVLAHHQERCATFRDALSAAEAGLNRIETTAAMRNAYSDILVPGLHVERAIALAAMGRQSEAVDECDALAAGFPGYAFLSTAIFRVRLIVAARAGDFAQAWEIAQTRSADMPISYRDELLCAMLKAGQEGADDDERARLGQTLRRSDSIRLWIRTVAPGLSESLGLFPDSVDRPRVALPRDEAPPSEGQEADSESPEKQAAL